MAVFLSKSFSPLLRPACPRTLFLDPERTRRTVNDAARSSYKSSVLDVSLR
jgi:hypothetical protein